MRCKYPDCSRNAAEHWAMVPLCHEHKAIIKAETLRYYGSDTSSRMKYSDRVEFLKIAHLIPWSQLAQGKVSE